MMNPDVNAVVMWHGSSNEDTTATVIATMIDNDNDDDSMKNINDER